MIFFLLVLVLPISLVVSRDRVTLIFWLILTLVSAFRYEVGTDYPNYVDLYNDIRVGYQSYLHMEPFHYFLNVIASYYLLGPQFIFLTYAIMTNSLFAFFFYKVSRVEVGYNHKAILSLCTIIFVGNYYFLTLNSIRSCLAAALYATCLYYFIKGNKLSMLLSMILGCFVHFSLIPIAIISLLSLKYIFPLKNKTFYLFTAVLLINPITILAYVFVTYKIIYYNYFISERYAVPASFIGQISAYGSVFLIIIFYFLFTKFVRLEDKKMLGILQLCTLSSVAFKLFSIDFFVLARISRYFSPLLYFFVSLSIVHFIQNYVSKIYRGVTFIAIVFLLTISNIAIFLPRGLSDMSYGNYKINYCLTSSEVCEIPVSIFK